MLTVDQVLRWQGECHENADSLAWPEPGTTTAASILCKTAEFSFWFSSSWTSYPDRMVLILWYLFLQDSSLMQGFPLAPCRLWILFASVRTSGQGACALRAHHSTSWNRWPNRDELSISICSFIFCIHPASRGVAAHTASLFRSVRGAKGGFPPWGLPKLRIFTSPPPAKADIATAILTNVIEHLVLLLPPNKHAVLYTFVARKPVENIMFDNASNSLISPTVENTAIYSVFFNFSMF